MRQPLRKRRGWAASAQLSFITILTFICFGCASEPSTSTREELLQKRIRGLVSSVDIEKSKNDTLNRTVARLENQLKNTRQKLNDKRRVPAPKVVKLRPGSGDEVGDAESDADVFEDVAQTRKRAELPQRDGNESIADSSHEAMHFYFLGLKESENRDYEGALRSFQEFLKVSPDHIYADRAQFWLAKNFLLAGEYDLAIVQANILEARYPHSFRIADGRLILGVAHLDSGQRAKGQEILRSVMKDFPGSIPAREAATRISKVSKLIEPPPQLLSRETP